jgi:hypothetical protein
MEIERPVSVAGFLGLAEAFLLAREAEHCLALGIAGTLRDHPEIHPEPPYLAVVTERDRVAAPTAGDRAQRAQLRSDSAALDRPIDIVKPRGEHVEEEEDRWRRWRRHPMH